MYDYENDCWPGMEDPSDYGTEVDPDAEDPPYYAAEGDGAHEPGECDECHAPIAADADVWWVWDEREESVDELDYCSEKCANARARQYARDDAAELDEYE